MAGFDELFEIELKLLILFIAPQLAGLEYEFSYFSPFDKHEKEVLAHLQLRHKSIQLKHYSFIFNDDL